MKYIDAEKLKVELDRLKIGYNIDGKHNLEYDTCVKILRIIDSLQQKQPEVDFEKESELIANGIMISVQANKYGTNIYNTERNDFNHHHLQMAARKGIKLGLKAQEK